MKPFANKFIHLKLIKMVGGKSVAFIFFSVACLNSAENRLAAIYDGPQMLSAFCTQMSMLTKKKWREYWKIHRIRLDSDERDVI